MNRLPERFWDKVYFDPNSGCWLWIGAISSGGYGVFRINDVAVQAHRISYSAFKADIPDGYQIDHLCRVRCCVNPDHLRAVTAKENILCGIGIAAENVRKTHCKRGHLLSGDNLYIRPDGKRACKQCQRNNDRKHMIKKKSSHELPHAV